MWQDPLFFALLVVLPIFNTLMVLGFALYMRQHRKLINACFQRVDDAFRAIHDLQVVVDPYGTTGFRRRIEEGAAMKGATYMSEGAVTGATYMSGPIGGDVRNSNEGGDRG